MIRARKWLAVILCVTMLASVLPTYSIAADYKVGLYWSKFHGMSNGEPVYSTTDVADFMWDETGQDINAVFLFWDGTAFTEVPFEELTFPAGLNYSQNEEYANAVYMKFDTALVGDITYTKDSVTYAFPLEVEDLGSATLETGLYWCWVEEDDDGNLFANQEDGYENSAESIENDDFEMAVFFVDGDTATPIAMEDLTFPSFISTELMEKGNDYFFNFTFDEPGTGVVTCADYPGYSFDVVCMERRLGYYTSPDADADTSLGEIEGVITGTVGETVTAYLVWDPAKTGPLDTAIVGRFHYAGDAYLIKTAELSDAAEILADNGITLTLNETDGYIKLDIVINARSMNLRLNIRFTDDYEESMWLSIDPENSSSGTEDPDAPSFMNGVGLYWYDYQGMDNGIPVYEYSNVDTSMRDIIGQDITAVFVFWDGTTATEVSPSELVFPKALNYEISDEYANAVYMEFDSELEAVITYTKDDVTYSFSIRVGLPDMGIYSAPERTKENLITGNLVYSGSDVDENGVACSIYYVLTTYQSQFTDAYVQFDGDTADASEIKVALMDDGTSAVLYLYEDVQINQRYTVYLVTATDGRWGQGFRVRDERPGLYWCWYTDVQDVLDGETGMLRANLEREINTTYALAFFYKNGENVTLLTDDANLSFGDFAAAEWSSADNGFDVELLKLGEHEITYTDENGNIYALPVTVVPPTFGFYSEPTASESAYLGKDFLFRGNPTTVYLVCREEEYTITDLELDVWNNGENMGFLTYTFDKSGRYIKLEISNAVLSDHKYSLAVWYTNEDGVSEDYRLSFAVQKKDPGLLWFPVEEDGNGSYIVTETNIHRSTMSCQPGDSFLVQIKWFDSADYTVLDLADLKMPSFMTAQTIDADNAILQITCDSLGVGEITSTLCPGLTIRVTAQTADALDFYTQPERSSIYADKNFNGEDGDVITRYLMWDQALLPDVDKVTVTLNDGEGNGNVLVDADITTTALSPWDIVLTPDLANGWVKVDATITEWRNITFKVWQGTAQGAQINVNIDEDYEYWGRGSSVLQLDYATGSGIVPLAFSMGSIDGDRISLDGFGGGGFSESTGSADHGMDKELIIGALAYEGESNESDAPAAAYAAISDVRFYIRKYVNQDGSGDQSECNIRLSDVYITQYNGMDVYAVRMLADPGQYARVQVGATFTVTLNGVSYTHSTYHRYGFKLTSEFEVDFAELDTADELNAVLASRDGLMNWIEDNEPDTYTGIRSQLAQGEFIALKMTLPPVQYTDVIHYSSVIEESFHGRIELYGSEDNKGNRTTLPGLRTENNDFFFLHDIDFVADPAVQQSYNNETFTCGILMYGDENSDIYNVMDCTFAGFDYGIYNTATGYTVCRRCVFTECDMAYLLDCEGKESGNGNEDLEDCRFANCGTAVRIKCLPGTHTPYRYRIHNCDFINNTMDIDVSMEGRFYFYQNYFGATNDGEVPEDCTDCYYRHARIRGRGYAAIMTNPRWVHPCTLPCGDYQHDNMLVIDPELGYYNYWLNEDEHRVSSAQFSQDMTDAEQPLEVTLTDESENTLGVWNFPNGDVDQTEMLSLLTDTADATFTLSVGIEESADGSLAVTVEDNAILAQRIPTLSIPCDYYKAKVQLNGEEIASTTINGMVTFAVVQGGEYVITAALTEEELEDAFMIGGNSEAQVDVGWLNYNAGESTDPSFVQIGKTTETVVEEIDPDKEDLEDTEETVQKVDLVTVQAVYQAPENATVTVLLVLYDINGRVLAMKQQTAEQNGGTQVITVECDASLIKTDAVQVRAFIIAADGSMTPLAPVPFSETLEI